MTNQAASFNLVDEKWILAQGEAGMDPVSLSDVLCRAHELKAISGDVPTQVFAITRILLAVVRRAIVWGENPIERWGEVWRSGHFPADEVIKYLDSVRHRFDVLDVTEPFYQVADLATAKSEFKPVELILADVPTGEKYFTTRAGKGAESLSLAEAARWLIHCHCYDISGIKSADARDPLGKGGKGYPIGVGWCGELGGTIFEGANVFDTLMLNTVLQGPDGEGPREADLPVWEQPHPGYRRRASLTPLGTSDLLTWQSRRIRLVISGERVRNVLVANGDPIDSHNHFNVEYMTEWRYSENQSKKFGDQRYLPRQWDADRVLWRGLEALTGDIADAAAERLRVKTSGTAQWIKLLLDEGKLDEDSFIRPHAYGLTYINQSSVVGVAIDDTVLMRLSLLSRNGESRYLAVSAVDSAAGATRALGTLARNLAQAAGGEGAGDQAAAESGAYFDLDHQFRAWVRDLTAEPDDDALPAWQRTVREIILHHGARLVDEAGQPAWLGREVNGRHLDSALADNWFRAALRKALPYAYQPQSKAEGS